MWKLHVACPQVLAHEWVATRGGVASRPAAGNEYINP